MTSWSVDTITRRLEAPLPPGRAARWWVGSTLAVLLSLSLFVASVWWRAPVAERVDGVAELQRQAGRVVAAVFSAGADTWRRDRERARVLVTETFEASAGAALAADPPPGVRSVDWAPRQVGVVDVQHDTGTAVLVVQVTVTPTAGEPTARDTTVSADFARHRGVWLLDALDELR
ncbi:MAG: hypothetical protein QM809_07605 [Gordonia sp. (in: high G+C Gram-positive bacteria)]|uniref:hypothetical protein n=1 Tax=Gordonia sp. (in: high G+C Gram-positive bacteria) TaxID=84139 RepID=UPI0039E46448